MMSAKPKKQTEAERLLLHIYNTQGPRGPRGQIVPVKRFAALPLSKVNTYWDFEGRMLMHEIAIVLTKRKRVT